MDCIIQKSLVLFATFLENSKLQNDTGIKKNNNTLNTYLSI